MSSIEASRRKRTKSRHETRLRASLDKSLQAYATAACAAGVSLMACAPPAAAKIVYTPANSYILPNKTLSLDLNRDGTADFLLSNTNVSTGTNSHGRWGHGSLKIKPQNSANAVWGKGSYASALRGGVRVGPNQHFQSGHGKMVRSHFSSGDFYPATFQSAGPWGDVTRRYLGLRFSIKGQLHYGWARLDVTVTYHGIYTVLSGYAYETVPNTPIVTGKTKGSAADVSGASQNTNSSLGPSSRPPASLGLLARGANGLDIWRKRRAICKLI
jgi:hypothetical protein